VYLKALEIQGFKSFPDKTVLSFGEDITAIVGPNGSGKSNISDAIRWVMGEQSTKNLRGAKMEDVIFGGTAKRPPMGFAQVTLVIDNTGHIFPTMEDSEVAVTRRYYRSGESEYYINRQSVRLRDVTELFLDTGMGKEGYSLIGQGKIDEILSTRSGDRREVFEEAAGISKYRHRKEESERKLERTEENLVRINDKIAELELQVEPLRDQAEKAKKYLVLRDELRSAGNLRLAGESGRSAKPERKLEIGLPCPPRRSGIRRAPALDALYAEGEQFGERMRQKDVEAEARPHPGGRSWTARLPSRSPPLRCWPPPFPTSEENIRPGPSRSWRSRTAAPAGWKSRWQGSPPGSRRSAGSWMSSMPPLQELLLPRRGRQRSRPAAPGTRPKPCGPGRRCASLPPQTPGPRASAAEAESGQIAQRRDRRPGGAGELRPAACRRPQASSGTTAMPWRTPGTRPPRRPTSFRATACGWRSASAAPLLRRNGKCS
jgi:energy-coupling factor transporter ATP-binding protein EcfA2